MIGRKSLFTRVANTSAKFPSRSGDHKSLQHQRRRRGRVPRVRTWWIAGVWGTSVALFIVWTRMAQIMAGSVSQQRTSDILYMEEGLPSRIVIEDWDGCLNRYPPLRSWAERARRIETLIHSSPRRNVVQAKVKKPDANTARSEASKTIGGGVDDDEEEEDDDQEEEEED